MDNDPFQYDESNMRMIETTEVTNELTKSILKPPKVRARAPLQEMDLGSHYSVTELDTIRKRRVSFAGVNKIKEFYSKAESAIIFSTPAYEETFSLSSDSSICASSFGGSIIHGRMSSSLTADDSDCAILNETMDLTDPLSGSYLKNETIQSIEETCVKENMFFQITPCSNLLVDKRESSSDSSETILSKESLENISVSEELLKSIGKLNQEDLVIDLGSTFESNPVNNRSESADNVFESKKAKKRKSCRIDESEPWLAFRGELLNKPSQEDDMFSSIPKNVETLLDNIDCSGARKTDEEYCSPDDGLDIPEHLANISQNLMDITPVTLTEGIPGDRMTKSSDHSGTSGTLVQSNALQYNNISAEYCIDMEMTEAIPKNNICLLQEKIEGYVDFPNRLINNDVPTYECLINSPCDQMSLTEAIPVGKLICPQGNYGQLDENNVPQCNVSAGSCNNASVEMTPCNVSQLSLTEASPASKLIAPHESVQLVNKVTEGTFCAHFYDNESMEMTEAIPKNKISVLQTNMETKGFVDFSGKLTKNDDPIVECLINLSSDKMSWTDPISENKSQVRNKVPQSNFCATFCNNTSMEMTEAIPKNKVCVLQEKMETKGFVDFPDKLTKNDVPTDKCLINTPCNVSQLSLTEAIPASKIIGPHESVQLVNKVIQDNFCADFYNNASMEMTLNEISVLQTNMETKGFVDFSAKLTKNDDPKVECHINPLSHKMSWTDAIPENKTSGCHDNFSQVKNEVPQDNFCNNTSMEMTEAIPKNRICVLQEKMKTKGLVDLPGKLTKIDDAKDEYHINSSSEKMSWAEEIPVSGTTGSYENVGQHVQNNVPQGKVFANFFNNTSMEMTEAIPNNKICVLQDFRNKFTNNEVPTDKCLINSPMRLTESITVSKITGSHENCGQFVRDNLLKGNADFYNNISMEMTAAIPNNRINNTFQEKMETRSFMDFPSRLTENDSRFDGCLVNSPNISAMRSEAIPVIKITESHENFGQLVENKIPESNVRADFCYDNTSMEITEVKARNKISDLQNNVETKGFVYFPGKLIKNDNPKDECLINSSSDKMSLTEVIPVSKTAGYHEDFSEVKNNVPQSNVRADFCNDNTSMEITEVKARNKISDLQNNVETKGFVDFPGKLIKNDNPKDECLINSSSYKMSLTEAIPVSKTAGYHEDFSEVKNNVPQSNVRADFCYNTSMEMTEALPKDKICFLQEKMETKGFVNFPYKLTKSDIRRDECLMNFPSCVPPSRLTESIPVDKTMGSHENVGQLVESNVPQGMCPGFCNDTSMEMTEVIPQNKICVMQEKIETKPSVVFNKLTNECPINSPSYVSPIRLTEEFPAREITETHEKSVNSVLEGNVSAEFCKDNASKETSEAISKNKLCVLQEKVETECFVDFPNNCTENNVPKDEYVSSSPNSPCYTPKMKWTEASKTTGQNYSHENSGQLVVNSVHQDFCNNTSMEMTEAIPKNKMNVLQSDIETDCFVDVPGKLTKNDVPTDKCLVNTTCCVSQLSLTEAIPASKIIGPHESVQLVVNKVSQSNLCADFYDNASMEMTETIPKNKICVLQEKMETKNFMDFPTKLVKNDIRTDECLINLSQMRLTEPIPLSKITGPDEKCSQNLNRIQPPKNNSNQANQTLVKQEKEEYELWGITKFNSSFFSEIGFKFVGPFHWVHALPLSMELIIEIPRKKVDMKTTIKNVSIQFEEENNRPGLNYTRKSLKQKFNLFLTSTMKLSKTIQYLIIAMKIMKDEFNLLSPFIQSLIFFEERYVFEVINGCIEFALSNISSWKQFKVSIDISKLKISGKNIKIVSIIGDPISEAAVQELFDNLAPTKKKIFQFLLELRKL